MRFSMKKSRETCQPSLDECPNKIIRRIKMDMSGGWRKILKEFKENRSLTMMNWWVVTKFLSHQVWLNKVWKISWEATAWLLMRFDEFWLVREDDMERQLLPLFSLMRMRMSIWNYWAPGGGYFLENWKPLVMTNMERRIIMVFALLMIWVVGAMKAVNVVLGWAYYRSYR